MSKCALIGKKCPEKSEGDFYCPHWVEGIVERNDATGEERVTRGCSIRLIPRWLTQSTHALAVNAGEVSAMRQSVVRAVEGQVRRRLPVEVGSNGPS